MNITKVNESLSNEEDHIGRVIYKNRGIYKVQYKDEVLEGTLKGKLVSEAIATGDLPAVGDWVLLDISQDNCRIEKVLPRKQKFARKQKDDGKKLLDGSGTTQEQILATNVDKAIIVTGMDQNFNLKRIERFLTLAYDGGVAPIIVLSKKDLCPQAERLYAEVEAIAYGVPIYMVSAITGEGIDTFVNAFKEDETVVFIGSSGVGKSTLSNALLGEAILDTGRTQVGTGKGRHTTTSAQLITSSKGVHIIDTPGMREVQLWADESSLQTTFEDIAIISERCKFSNCTHQNEPGCAIVEGLKSGLISEDRYANYQKLQRELAFLEKKKAQVQKNQNKKHEKYDRKQFKRAYD